MEDCDIDIGHFTATVLSPFMFDMRISFFRHNYFVSSLYVVSNPFTNTIILSNHIVQSIPVLLMFEKCVVNKSKTYVLFGNKFKVNKYKYGS